MLTINNLSKSFGGVHAVQDVSFTVKEGNMLHHRCGAIDDLAATAVQL